MRFLICLSLLGLTACVDPLPVGEGGAFGPVLGTAPREAVGPGPFATGGGGSSGATGIGTAVAENDPRRLEGFTRAYTSIPDSAYVGGQEHVTIHATDLDDAVRQGLNVETTWYGSVIVSDTCGFYVDIYGRRYGNGWS